MGLSPVPPPGSSRLGALPQPLLPDFLRSAPRPVLRQEGSGCPERLILPHPWRELVLASKPPPCRGVPGTCNAFCTRESWVGLFCICVCLFALFSSALKSLLCRPEPWREPSSRGGWRRRRAGFHPRELLLSFPSIYLLFSPQDLELSALPALPRPGQDRTELYLKHL